MDSYLRQQCNLNLKFYKPINGCSTVEELALRGCPICYKRLFPEASVGFGSLHCSEHKGIWLWIPTFREKRGYAPKAWKNLYTGKMSVEFEKRWGKRL